MNLTEISSTSETDFVSSVKSLSYNHYWRHKIGEKSKIESDNERISYFSSLVAVVSKPQEAEVRSLNVSVLFVRHM